MNKRIAKLVIWIMYFMAGGVVSFFLPVEIRYSIGFVMALISGWAYRVMTKEVNNG